MGDPEAAAQQPGLQVLLPSREFLTSRKGQLLLGEAVLSFVIFICYVASYAVAFMTVPLIELLLAVFYFYAYSSKLNEKFKGIHWPVANFVHCVIAAILYFAISIAVVAQYYDGASKAAGVFGFIATIVYAVDFYFIFNDLTQFIKQGDSADPPQAHKSEEEDSDSD